MTPFPKYPKYKDSGVEWLGQVPQHWEVSRSRRVFKQRTELARRDDQQLSATQAYGVIPQADYEERIGRKVTKISMHLEKRKHVELDDFVISMRSFQGGLERAWAQGCIRSSYTVLEPAIKVASSYFAYLFKSPQYIGALQATGNFIRDGQDLTFQNYILVDLPLPPLAEQTRIGAFLDEKTAQIGALIAKKQRQIELLDEQKAILINRAVTRGLHPSPELQDSGIPWIGPIPKHWKPVALRRLVQRIEQGVSPSTVEGDVGPQDWGVLKSGCTNGGVFRETEHKRLPKRFKIDPSIVVRRGDLLVSRACGSRDLVASTALVEDLHFNLILSDKNFRLVLGDAVLPSFLSHSMNSWHFRRQIEPRISGAEGLPNNIPGSRLVEVVIPLPDLKEQRAVVAHLDSLRLGFNKLTQQIESQIQTLQTLRSTLIAHAVTGKIAISSATV